MNAIEERLGQLKGRNYIRRASSENYWFGWERSIVERHRRETGGAFYLIVYGSSHVERDFFVIPFGAVEHVLTEENMVKGENAHRRRWVGSIHKQMLKLSGVEAEVDLSRYYGDLTLLELAAGGLQVRAVLAPGDGDTADADDETPYAPGGVDRRPTVLRQIKARRGQQAFRDALRGRYGDQCLITGCRLLDVVEAAHIIPYRGESDNDPANGLLLRADVHTLFDLDLLGVEPGSLVVHLHPAARTADYGSFEGVRLRCQDRSPSKAALAVRWEAFQQTLCERTDGRGGGA